MGSKYANVVGVLLTVLVVLMCMAIQQSWSAMSDTQQLREDVSVHAAEANLKQDYIKEALEDIRNDVKDIKAEIKKKGYFK